MKIYTFLLLGFILVLTSCAPRVGTANIYHRDQPIEIELQNFSFSPDHFVVLGNESPILLSLRNTSNVQHNFTLMAPDRTFTLSKDLEPNSMVTLNIESLKPDNYLFYCSFHQHRGMEGMMMVH
jgi:uncharacterized cupredoxin-like copper-binding protein